MRIAFPLPVLFLACLARLAGGQEMSGLDRERDRLMVRAIEDDIRKYYYDSTVHGLDLAALFDSAKATIGQAHSNSEAFLAIALALNALHDSHTFFFPPERAVRVRYGWNLGIIGDSCYVLRVDPKSDAAAQGVKPGDRVVAVDRFAANRRDRWNLEYFYDALAPRTVVRLVLQSPGDTARVVVVHASVVQHPAIMDLTRGEDIWRLIREQQDVERAIRSRWVEYGKDVLVWKLPEFSLDDDGIDRFFKHAQDFKALVIDLRGDPGGTVSTLLRIAGALVGPDTIGSWHERSKTSPARTRAGSQRFAGPVVAVVDAQSASAAEILAYLLQMRKRGTVVGDRTAGAVMEARGYQHTIGAEVAVFYYTSVTVADLVFADGTRLEGRGVIPDEIVLPSGADLATRRDPALARAIGLAGLNVTPEAAGALFPPEH